MWTVERRVHHNYLPFGTMRNKYETRKKINSMMCRWDSIHKNILHASVWICKYSFGIKIAKHANESTTQSFLRHQLAWILKNKWLSNAINGDNKIYLRTNRP